MTYETLIRVEALQALLSSGQDIVLLDCEFDLAAPDAGYATYLSGHIPTARYAHLDHDLADTPTGQNGRHPLPNRDTISAWLRAQGLHAGQQVIAYDSHGGAWAARAWWLLKWLGHAPVAVLDGGKPAWIKAGLPLATGGATPVAEGDFTSAAPLVPAPVTAQEVLANITTGNAQVLDARDPTRFAGHPNPLDPVAGHIPAAKNRFFRNNLDENGQLRSPEALAQDFTALINGKPVILQCGSGVTACHNALAMAIAGLPAAHLYPGSWSEWISDPSRPVATDLD